MDYLGLTTTKQVISVLMLDDMDVDDAVIDGRGMEDDLEEALDSNVPTWRALIDGTVPENAVNFRRLRIFAKYQCGAWTALMAANFILKKDTDGSNEIGRSDKDGYAWMAPALQAKADDALMAVMTDLGIAPVSAPLSIISRVEPTRDVITEPRSSV